MKNKVKEIFIPGPCGRIQAKYIKSEKENAPIAIVLQPHPQYGGTMNNKIVVETFNQFMDNDFSVCRVNFRGVGKSDVDKKVNSVCPYCGVGCQIEYNVKDNDIKYVNGFDGPANKNRVCIKG